MAETTNQSESTDETDQTNSVVTPPGGTPTQPDGSTKPQTPTQPPTQPPQTPTPVVNPNP
jgi:hypothetical protein